MNKQALEITFIKIKGKPFDKICGVSEDGDLDCEDTFYISTYYDDNTTELVQVDRVPEGFKIGAKYSVVEQYSYSMLNKDIADLDLTVRSYNCLKEAKIKTIGELLELTSEDLLKIKNLGRKSYKEIVERLLAFGFKLKGI